MKETKCFVRYQPSPCNDSWLWIKASNCFNARGVRLPWPRVTSLALPQAVRYFTFGSRSDFVAQKPCQTVRRRVNRRLTCFDPSNLCWGGRGRFAVLKQIKAQRTHICWTAVASQQEYGCRNEEAFTSGPCVFAISAWPSSAVNGSSQGVGAITRRGVRCILSCELIHRHWTRESDLVGN